MVTSSTQDIDFRGPDGRRLRGTIHRPDRERGVGVVVAHGMLSSRESEKHRGICGALAAVGLTALRFDFSGRGESEGSTREITYERQRLELESALALIGAEVDETALVGSSMGAAVSLLVARDHRELSGVVGIATVGRPLAVLEGLTGGDSGWREWERRGIAEIAGHSIGWCLAQSSRETDVLSAAGALTCPLLLIHGSEDDVVPIEQARALQERALGSRLVVIEGGDHLLHRPEDQRTLEGLARDFLCSAFGLIGS